MTETTTTWSTPHDVSPLELAFPGDVSHLMPLMGEIPEEFRDPNAHGKWQNLQADWFFSGLKNVQWSPKPGIDTSAAIRHLGAIQGSWSPRHEHKQAAVAYLASLWFDDVTYDLAKDRA